MTDAAIVAWVLRLFSNWIERSGLTYKNAALVARCAIIAGRHQNNDTNYLKREAAVAVMCALQEAGPTTL